MASGGTRGEVTLELDAAGRATQARGRFTSTSATPRGRRARPRRRLGAPDLPRRKPAALEVGGPAGPLVVATADERGCVTPPRGPWPRGRLRADGWAPEAGRGRGAPANRDLALRGRGGRVADLDPRRPRARDARRARPRGRRLRRGRAAPAGRAPRGAGSRPRAWPLGPRARSGRDDAGRVVVVEVGPAGRTTFERDGAGRVRTRTDGAGRVPSGRSGTAPAASSRSPREKNKGVAFEHDLAGRPVRAVASAHALTFEWDAHGRPDRRERAGRPAQLDARAARRAADHAVGRPGPEGPTERRVGS